MDFTSVQKENTIKFWEEFKFMERLRGNVEEEEEESDDLSTTIDDEVKSQITVSPFDTIVTEGEIRIIPQADKITYIVVLQWDETSYLAVPFSHYETPATDKELLAEDAEKRGLFQQVYQCWNARSVPKHVLAKSWCIGRVSDTEIVSIKKVLKYCLLGDELPAVLKNRTALPVFKLEDPRIKYMSEEKENLRYFDNDEEVE